MNPLSDRFVLGAVSLGALLLISVALTIGATPGNANPPLPTKFTVNGKSYAITKAATTDAQRQAGLMNTRVTNSTIMLFAFPTSGHYQFWMYDTNTSLDIIWVETNGDVGRVVYLVNSAPPCYVAVSCQDYTPTADANYVLEAKSGFAQANLITIGSTIQFA